MSLIDEEISRSSIAISVRASKLTARGLAYMLRAAGRQIAKRHKKAQRPHGRQSVKKLMAHGENVNSIEGFRNGKFKFKGLESIIIESITSYVESKERIRSSNASNTGTQLGSSAAIKFMKASTKNIDVFLGEMLLYLFLEQELGAPKIMSKIEIDEVSGSLKSASEGIHLLAAPNCDDFQLVCGASEIHGDLNNAANRAFEKVELIIDNEENEFAFVSNADFDREFPTKIRKYLVDELVPEERKEVKANLSFGILLGYTANVDLSGLDYSQYNNALEKQIIADLTHLKSYISDLVQASGYEGYSFYVFVVPFNDADIEKKELIEDLFGR